MKQIFSLSIFLTVALTALAQNENVIRTDSNIENITVYLNGAEIKRSQEISVKQGKNIVLFRGLSPSLQPGSIQFSASGDHELSSVTVNDYEIKAESIDPYIKTLKDSTDLLEQKIESLNNQIDSYNAERNLLKENQRLGNSQTGITTTELIKAADFYRERTLLINNSLSRIQRQVKESENDLNEIKMRLEKLEEAIDIRRKEVAIVINSPATQKIRFNIKYLTGNAGWSPVYDIIAKDISNPVELKYKAEIYNNTAIDWKDVKIKLSTADPSLGASRPYLTTWNLNYTSGRANEGMLRSKASGALAESVVAAAVEYEDVTVSELSAEFDIDKLQSIPSDIKPFLIDITSYELDAKYEYLSIPKVDQSAFLLARITGWEKLNLIDGVANVYFGDTYIGKSGIDTKSVSDTLDLSLGRDNQIQILRSKIEDKSGSNFIGTKKSESFTYEINVKNNRKSPIEIKIQDQVPVSQESDISVEVLETSGAVHDPMSGKLEWIKTVSPGEGTKILLSFEVKYPKNKNVVIRKNRVVRTPRFRR